MSVRLLGIGVATPGERLAQADAAAMAARLEGADDDRARTLRALYRRSGVGERGVSIRGLELRDAGTAARMAAFSRAAADLGERACRTALERAETGVGAVTHLVTVSCTGMESPGVDLALIERLGLDAGTQRVNVGFMGCHGAVNGLRVARALAAESGGARVLVCSVEVCSVHYQHDDPGEGATVANALFGDGAAACVVGGPADGWGGPTLLGTSSRVFAGTAGDMSWRVGDRGFRMTLSARVPSLIERAAPGWVDAWLGEHGLTRAGVGAWAIHPGGPRVLASVRAGLGLADGATAASEAVLREHGNMSSATILAILDRMLREGAARPIVGLAFGPGLTGEGVLIG